MIGPIVARRVTSDPNHFLRGRRSRLAVRLRNDGRTETVRVRAVADAERATDAGSLTARPVNWRAAVAAVLAAAAIVGLISRLGSASAGHSASVHQAPTSLWAVC